MPSAIRSRSGWASIYPKSAINLGGVLPLNFGVGRNDVEGNPDPPSLCMMRPAKFRFRWSVRSGSHSLSIRVKQASNAQPRPSLTVKANAAIGLFSDLVGVAADGVDWVTIGPLKFTTSAQGALDVFLACNNAVESDAGCFWDHLVVL